MGRWVPPRVPRMEDGFPSTQDRVPAASAIHPARTGLEPPRESQPATRNLGHTVFTDFISGVNVALLRLNGSAHGNSG